MRNASTLVCFLIIALGFGDAETLRPRRVKAFAARSSGAPPPQFAVPSGFQRINAGDVVTGTVIPSSTQIYYEVIAPANGTLMVTLNWDPSLGFLALVGQGAHFFYFPGSAPPTIAALPVAAGGTYRFSVQGGGYWYYYFEDPVPFVLTTSLELEPVVVPGVCAGVPPGLDWLCVRGNIWVPRDHPLAAPLPPALPPVPPPTGDGSTCSAIQPSPTWVCLGGNWVPPGAVPPPPPPPPAVTPVGCASIQPAATWVCVNGNWLPPDHPLALTAQPNPAPPTSPPPPTTCTTPDPFVGIPGLSGVCVNGGWVPIGHPLARGGG